MVICVDVGATKTLVATWQGGKPANIQRFTTPNRSDDFLGELKTHLDRLNGMTALSVAVPGIVTAEGILLRCGNLGWSHDLPIKKILEDAHSCDVFVENDANLAGLHEINNLDPLPRIGIYLTVSTGIGSGIIVNGKLAPEVSRSEAGHMMLWHNNQFQAWEEFASGKAMAKEYGELVRDFDTSSQWEEFAERLSKGLLALIPAFLPEVIVFGGGAGHYFEKVRPLLEEKIQASLDNYIAPSTPRLIAAKHPEEAVLYGCHHFATNR